MITRFDAYTATLRASKPHLLIPLCLQPDDEIKTRKGHHGFAERYCFIDSSGSESASISFGGTHADLVMVEAKGERTPAFVETLRSSYEHRCTRVDSCYDVDEEGAFDRLLKPCIEIKKGYGLKGSKAGDWEDFPEDGRTLYVGANTSPIKLRLYEKGLQPEYRHANRPNWVRAELQVRPQKDSKSAYSLADSLAVWGASKWTRELASLILDAELQPLPAGTVRKLSERDRALFWVAKQYGKHFSSLAHDLGSWELVGLKLAQLINEK
jgi:hypothetical protein